LRSSPLVRHLKQNSQTYRRKKLKTSDTHNNSTTSAQKKTLLSVSVFTGSLTNVYRRYILGKKQMPQEKSNLVSKTSINTGRRLSVSASSVVWNFLADHLGHDSFRFQSDILVCTLLATTYQVPQRL